MTTPQTVAQLEANLNSFDAQVRLAALHALMNLVERGDIELPEPADVANMHCHTFFSFNGYGHSPSSLAWLGKKHGFKLMGIVDFDVLDAVDEFLLACDTVALRGSAGLRGSAALRGSAGLETRVFLPQFASREINSPGEPGVYYHMGIGFSTGQVPVSAVPLLADLRRRATERNQTMLVRINAHLSPLTIDYAQDVLSLTPNGNATERHMLAAYIQAAENRQPDPITFWAGKLNMEPDQVAALINDKPQFQNVVRAKLMKRGGVGYVQPAPDTFPTLEEFHQLILACGALPCVTWLDGTSAGEEAIEELLELLIGKGAAAMNIIPDRNWNIPDPATKQRKLQKLYEVVEAAKKYDLPLNIGTEMNAYGQKLVDDFDAPELAPVRQAFLDGAYFIYGHTALQRLAGLGYQSDWAKNHLPSRRERNQFYTNVGRRVSPGQTGLTINAAMLPGEILSTVSAKNKVSVDPNSSRK